MKWPSCNLYACDLNPVRLIFYLLKIPASSYPPHSQNNSLFVIHLQSRLNEFHRPSFILLMRGYPYSMQINPLPWLGFLVEKFPDV